jgi:pimeloyl-ACP methyl ester carboxylesterase
MSNRFGPLLGTVSGPADAPVTAVLLHGIGLGPWLYDPWAPAFAEAGVRTVALDLHSGRDAGFSALIEDVSAALDSIGGPLALVGHSMGGLLAQSLAARRALSSLALVCPLPPGQIQVTPPKRALLGAPDIARALVTGGPLRVGWRLYRNVGLEQMDEPTARAVYARTRPWPQRLARDLAFARPVVDVTAVHAPVLVALGRRDQLVPWETSRILGDLYEAVTWRYDDLAHMPMWEPGGERMGRDLARWVANPSRPQVLESEGYGPSEGVGHTLRRERRGEEMKRRSAYGQKRSARDR